MSEHEHEHGCGCGCGGSSIILFQGDSITDAGRDYNDPNSLGPGYPMMIAAWYQAKHPTVPVQFLNRGKGGDRTADLVARWDADAMALEPDVVSILIGINDVWRRYDSNDPTSVDVFEKNYRNILTRTTEESDADIIIMEPFVLAVPDDRKTWREDLDPKIQVVRALAAEFSATLIPLDGIFAQVAVQTGPEKWAADGVHPTLAGHALIAQKWLEIVDED